MQKRAIYWFRNDLRLSDNVGLNEAVKNAEEVLPIYIFDPRDFRQMALGFHKTGVFRAKFLLESVQNLRDNLKARGQNLVIRIGKPEEILSELADDIGAEAVYASKEATEQETDMESSVSKRLKMYNIDFELFWQSTLYHPKDLPFWVSRLPDVFTDYKNTVEEKSTIRSTVAQTPNFMMPEGVEIGKLPEIYELILFSEVPQKDTRQAMDFRGGETAALERLNHFVWQSEAVKTYKETRNGLLGADYSSKFSAWLSLGCLSPRQIYEAVRNYESQHGANDSTYWLIYELIWRDYFRFVALKYGARLFKPQGIKHQVEHRPERNRDKFRTWVNGQTGDAFVDANMRELRATGFMSNRGRQNVASFLVKDLGLDWTWGARYFESQLIDYDVCSNWGNWNYVAGVGNDPRPNRYFNTEKQAEMYDADGAYRQTWLG